MTMLAPTAHTIDDGIETWTFPSTLTESEQHYLSQVDGVWQILPIQTADLKRDLTLDEARTLARELVEITTRAESLERERRRVGVGRVDAAISAEILHGMATLGWTADEAAAEYSMTKAMLSHRLGGFSSWTLVDISLIVLALGDTAERREEIFMYLASIAFKSSEAAL